MSIDKNTFLELLKAALNVKASDIHIRQNESPCFRIHGDLVPVKSPPVSLNDIQLICNILMNSSNENIDLNSINDIDGSITFNNVCRVRYNIFRFTEKFAIILRLIENNIPTLGELKFNPSIKNISLQSRGLILITGATGSGKSTTMASMLNYINHKRSGHIITIEDPIEYLLTQKHCRITQREVGIDTKDFNTGLKSALRQDPDVICIGEMRDRETFEIALRAAETDHLVISTIHTQNAENTIGRIISMFPSNEQGEVKRRLADNLRATISQRLVKRKDKSGMLAVQEIMVTSPGIKECILNQNNMNDFYTYIKESYKHGDFSGQTFDQHLNDLLQKNLISKEEALKAASHSEDFRKKLEFE